MTQIDHQTLFANDIHRRIEEVIKVDQTDEEIIRDEIDEYVVTDAIRPHYIDIFDATERRPTSRTRASPIWVSGFFGSGKSSFAKMLGLSIENRTVAGSRPQTASPSAPGQEALKSLLKTINEKIPTHAVIFDVSTDRGIRSGNQTLTEIMYGLFLQSLGYAKDLDLSELEIGLEEKASSNVSRRSTGASSERNGTTEKGKIAFALSEASRVAAQARSRDLPDGRFVGEGGQEQGRHHAGQARRARR